MPESPKRLEFELDADSWSPVQTNERRGEGIYRPEAQVMVGRVEDTGAVYPEEAVGPFSSRTSSSSNHDLSPPPVSFPAYDQEQSLSPPSTNLFDDAAWSPSGSGSDD